MSITTKDIVEKYGTQDTVTGSTSSVANNAFSVSGDVSAWTNDDDAVLASFVLTCAFGTAPTVGSNVNLYARLLGIDGANNQDAPTANFLHTFLGAFPVKNVTTTQRIALEVNLPNTKTSQQYEFYIENKTGQTISTWDLKVTPKALGPHA